MKSFAPTSPASLKPEGILAFLFLLSFILASFDFPYSPPPAIVNQGDPIPESYYNYQPQVDMSEAPKNSPTNAAGFKRNANWFWKKRLELNPEMFSKANVYRINILSLAPQIDEAWVKHNPTHTSFHRIDQVTGKKMALHHHHINQGNFAVALPAEVHRKWSGILHQRFKKGFSGFKGRGNIKSAISKMDKGLGIAGLILDLKGAFKGDPHSLFIEFQPISKNAKLDQLYYDNRTNTYIVANRMGEWDIPPESGPHKNWKRVVWVSQYVDYAWDNTLRKYVGIGLLAEGYQIYYANGRYRNVQIRCFSNSPNCLIL